MIFKNICFMKTPVGVVKIVDDGEYLTGLEFAEHACACCLGALASDIGRKTKRQLEEYFAGNRKEFDIPIRFEDTCFREEIWETLLGIPYGETRSYKELAIAAGKSNASRAVGGALHNNPIAIVVPCHRVVSSSGDLGGYAYGENVKRSLLRIEGADIKERSLNGKKTNV